MAAARWVSDAEAAGIVRLAKGEPTIGLEHEELRSEENLQAWKQLWGDFLAYVRTSVDHRGFYVY